MKFLRVIISLVLVHTLAACEPSNSNIPAFANPDAPEYRALMFFDAVYNSKNIGMAQKYTTQKLARILRSYGSTRNYSRYILNLQMDPGVELKIDRSLNQVSIGREDQTSVNILFTGTHNEEPVNDVRKVMFIRVDGEWLINSVEDDPYMKK